jgi:L-ascorbate metabolism protein UlaG (beta-lactamase superfamily)
MRRGLIVALALVLGLVVGAWGAVTVTYLGHSCFTIESEGGFVVMIDPYGTYVPYPALPRAADVVLITHGHIDHCPMCFGEEDRILGDPLIIWPFGSDGRVREGQWKLTDGLSAVFVEATHVTASGGGHGLVCLFSFELDGIRFAHLGDLGRPLTAEQIAALGEVDVLFVPVGGAYTIDAAEAIGVIEQLDTVSVVFPMHYLVDGITPWTDLDPLATFVDLLPNEWAVRVPEAEIVTLDELPETIEVWTPTYAR